ncbi:unnamed protein product [Polarella glacialis]|uniref:TMEM205-like domain-containing protein n=1 Tax=Polarella glacialis TaxID=89957 RepID=A0A813LS71_POLGL|nr:unnamed protein product [Polarella glacialis]
MPRSAGMTRVAFAVALGASAALLSSERGAFSYSPALQLRQNPLQRHMQSPAPLSLEGERQLAGASSAYSFSVSAARGIALSLVALIALEANPTRHYKRDWKKKVRSQCNGRRATRSDKRPGVLQTEKPPYEAKKIYHYYCNKMYKVIRESGSATLDMAPVSLGERNDEFVRPAVWNTSIFRSVAILLGGAAAGGVLPGVAMLHLSAFGIWLGTNVWTTFIAGITMFKNLPRQQFGSLQAKLFPKYFQMGAACTAVMLGTASRMGLPMGPALVTLLTTLANMLYLEPQAYLSAVIKLYNRRLLVTPNTTTTIQTTATTTICTLQQRGL